LNSPERHHRGWVRLSHLILTFSFFALAITGYELIMTHPRFYWGEAGNELTPALFELPVSRNYKHGGWTTPEPFLDQANSPVSAGRTYDIFNQNGWGRSLHFLSAWFLVIVGFLYLGTGVFSGHFWKNIIPHRKEFRAALYWQDLVNHLKMKIISVTGPNYGLLQKTTYGFVLFLLMPITVLTGFTMSPAITADYPFLLKMFFGAQSARTIHFFCATALVLFLIVHLVMIIKTGFKKQILSITMGK
jgi:thiosulfate reductase cytochrome b subunit